VLVRLILAVAALFAATGFGSGERFFAPSADPWERWNRHDQTSAAVIDHSSWTTFLAANLKVDPRGTNLVRYGAVSAGDRARLDGYITSLSSVAIDGYTRTEQLAYWINLYNALTVRVVLDHHPVASIRDIDISPGFFADGPWGKALVKIAGEAITLNDIEHRILRPLWRDPRVHYALNCASIGCPDLVAQAYTGDNVERLLDAAARAYVNDPRGVSISDGRVTISKIYDWFHADFGGTDQAVFDHILSYAEPDLQARLTEIGNIHGVAYDWRLNDAG